VTNRGVIGDENDTVAVANTAVAPDPGPHNGGGNFAVDNLAALDARTDDVRLAAAPVDAVVPAAPAPAAGPESDLLLDTAEFAVDDESTVVVQPMLQPKLPVADAASDAATMHALIDCGLADLVGGGTDDLDDGLRQAGPPPNADDYPFPPSQQHPQRQRRSQNLLSSVGLRESQPAAPCGPDAGGDEELSEVDRLTNDLLVLQRQIRDLEEQLSDEQRGRKAAEHFARTAEKARDEFVRNWVVAGDVDGPDEPGCADAAVAAA
jgi:hypothetical protein